MWYRRSLRAAEQRSVRKEEPCSAMTNAKGVPVYEPSFYLDDATAPSIEPESCEGKCGEACADCEQEAEQGELDPDRNGGWTGKDAVRHANGEGYPASAQEIRADMRDVRKMAYGSASIFPNCTRYSPNPASVFLFLLDTVVDAARGRRGSWFCRAPRWRRPVAEGLLMMCLRSR
jgi:hypothetical protein